MIPEFWLEPTVYIFVVAVIAHVTGGTAMLVITPEGIHYGIER